MVCGSTATMTSPTTSGMAVTVSSSSVPATLFVFATFLGGFYFNDLIHPPSILPISFIFSERFMYFLLSNDFISQVTCKKNLSKSNLIEALFSEINFSNLFELLAFIVSSVTSKNKESTFAPRVYFESFGKSGKYSCHNL